MASMSSNNSRKLSASLIETFIALMLASQQHITTSTETSFSYPSDCFPSVESTECLELIEEPYRFTM